MKKTKLLLVMPALGSGGAEKSFVSLLGVLPRDRFDISVMVVNEGGLFYGLLPTDVTMVEAPKQLRIALGSIHSRFMREECGWGDKLRKAMSNVLVRFRGLTKLDLFQLTWTMWSRQVPMLQGEWDVAVSFMNGLTNYFVIDKVRAARKVLWVHNDYAMFRGNSHGFDQTYWAKADRVVTISDVCVSSLEKAFPALKDKFVCVENISSAQMIRAMANDPCPEEYSQAPNGATILLSIGRLAEQKGFDMAIDAAALLKDRGMAFRWFIIGVGGLKAQLQAQIDSLGVGECVTLLGERANPYTYMSHSDIVVQTSRYEGKSIVLDEAKILHKPIVVTNYPSAKDNITDGETGVVCRMDAEGIATAIASLAEDKGLQESLSANLAKTHNGNEAEVEKYVELFAVG